MTRLLAVLAALLLAAPATALAADFPTDLDPVRAGAGADEVDAGRGADLVAGGDGADDLAGGAGDDVLVDSDGRDRAAGGAGDDRINVRDGRGGDQVACGPGRDVVVADPGDRVAGDCEWVSTRDAAGLVRQEASTLTDDQKRDLVAAMHELKRTPSPYDPKLPWYDQFVAWHDAAFDGNPSAHESAAFLPWHRQFLLQFEAALQTVSGKPIAIPYWDWSVNASTAAVFADDLAGPTGDPLQGHAVTSGPFRKGLWRLWARDDGDPSPFVPPSQAEELAPEGRWLKRAIGETGYGRLPNPAGVTAMLANTPYDAAPWNRRVPWGTSFRNGLEGWGSGRASHNTVHVWVGGQWDAGDVDEEVDGMGTMGLGTSPNDPVFWLHHANIDRLWSTWAAVNDPVYLPRSGGPEGMNRDDTMEPFSGIGIDVTPGDLLSTRALGYAYDSDGEQGAAGRRTRARALDLHEVAAEGGLLCVL